MTADGNHDDDDDDDFGGNRRDRDRGQRRGGRREFTGDMPDFGEAPPDAGNPFGDGDRGGYRGGGNRGGPGGGQGGGQGGGPGGGGYSGGDRNQGGGYRSGGAGGGYQGGGRDQGSGGGYRGGGDQGGGYRGGGAGAGGSSGGRPQNQDREAKQLGPRRDGVLKFFNSDRGFGFISPEDGSKDVFVHISAIERSGLPQLEEGTKLSFETEDDRRGRGPQAVNLQLLDD